jgi:hypothetical protein
MKKIRIPGINGFIRHQPSRRIMNTRGKLMV